LFTGFGGAFALLASNYSFGRGLELGPGAFPTYVALILVAIGLGLLGKAFFAGSPAVGAIGWFPLVCVLAAVLLFSLLNLIGLVLVLAGMVLLSKSAGTGLRWRETVILYVVLLIAVVGIFKSGFGLDLPLLPQVWS
jgi:hypothetical protein